MAVPLRMKGGRIVTSAFKEVGGKSPFEVLPAHQDGLMTPDDLHEMLFLLGGEQPAVQVTVTCIHLRVGLLVCPHPYSSILAKTNAASAKEIFCNSLKDLDQTHVYKRIGTKE